MSTSFALHGAGLGLRRSLLPELLNMDVGAVDFLECAPDNWIGVGGAYGESLARLAERFPLSCHGLSLSLGGPEPLDHEFLRRIRAFLDQHDVPLFSEHLSYCSDDGHLYDLIPMPFTDEERSLLAPYVTSLDAPIFALKGLPEEVVAVLFAYYSRSREDLRANLLRLLREGDLDLAGRAVADPLNEGELETARRKAREFHEKWVVGYGHASVAEHAVAHVAIEDVSIVASKVIEDARSYQ